MKKSIITITKKEFYNYFNSPLAYTIIVPFLLLSIFLFLRSALASGEANLRPYFDLLPWFLLLLAPALSMKLLTDEYKSNTFELLFAHPVTEFEIIAGKFLGSLLFYLVILGTTLGLPLTMILYSRIDPGQMLGQYIGAVFIGSAFLAISIAASSYVKNAISSFLLSASIGFLLILIGIDFFSMVLPYPFSSIASQLSILSRTENVARGLLDVRDLMYFVTLIGISLIIAVTRLSERKLIEDKKEKSKLNLALVLVIVIGVLSNILLVSFPLRFDLTSSRLFTLSEGTKQTVRNLPDIVNIKLFASNSLPSQMQSAYQQTTDLLSDYQKLGSKVRVKIFHPDTNNTDNEETQNAGIQQMTFNKMGSGKFEVQQGYLGLSIQYGDKKESIPFISDTNDLEYQLTRRIRKITQTKDKTIGILTNGYVQTRLLTQVLETQYKTQNLTNQNIPDSLSAIIVIDSGVNDATNTAILKNYLDNNGKMLYLGSGVSINPQSLSAQKSTSVLSGILLEYGITINTDLVYDLSLNELLSFGRGNVRYMAPYPYWIKSIPQNSGFPPISSVKSISLGWPSSLKIEDKTGTKISKLLTSGKNGGRTESGYNISPQGLSGLIPQGEQTVAVLAEKGEAKLVVIGASSIADDQFIQNNEENISFISNTVDWLASDKDLAAIPSKTGGRAIFIFRNPFDMYLVQYGNLIIPPLAVIIFAVYYLRRRKLQALRKYYAE